MVKKTFLILLLIGIVFAVYANSLNGPFLFDDTILVRDNPLIRSITNISAFFKTDIFAHKAESTPISNSYRPLQTVTYALDFFLWGNDPQGFHLTSVIIHIINTLLVFLFIKKISGNFSISYLTSLIFGIHPINTQCVSYISGRADLLVATFTLLSIVTYINSKRDKKKGTLFLSALFYLFAIYSKEIAIIILPLILVIYNIISDKEKTYRPRSYIFHAAALALYFPQRLAALDGLVPRALELSRLDIFPRVFTSIKSLFIDVRMLLFPYDLHFGRTTDVESSIFGSIYSILTVAGIILAAYMLRLMYKRWQEKKDAGSAQIFFGISFFLVTMAPLLNIVPLQVFHSDNWLYLPAVGIYLAFIAFVKSLITSKQSLAKGMAPILTIAALFYYGHTTIERNKDYQDEIRFFLSSLEKRPSVKFCRTVGALYGERGDYEKSIKYLNMAVETNKIYPAKEEAELAYFNLGITYMNLGKYKEAKESFEKVLISTNVELRLEAERHFVHIVNNLMQ